MEQKEMFFLPSNYGIFSILPNLVSAFISSSFTFESLLNIIFTPSWAMWYILAIVFWSLTLLIIKKIYLWHILMAILFTLIIGYLPFIGGFLTLSRFFYFLPFYWLGKWCSQNKDIFHEFIQKFQKPLYKIISGLVLLTTLLLLIFVFKDLPFDFFYGRSCYQNPIDIFNRLLCIILGFINGLAIILLIPFNYSPKNKLIVNIGQRTLNIYIFHILILLVISSICSLLPNILLDNTFFALGFTAILSVPLLLTTYSKPFYQITNYFICLFD